MACYPAPACQAALNQATQLWPGRSNASDGICPSREHYRRNPGSDHSTGNAWDLTHDPGHGVDCHRLAEAVKDDPRVKYVIWNRRIHNTAVSANWRRYSGDNPHTQHMHVSIRSDRRKDVSAWFTEEDEFTMDDEAKKRFDKIELLVTAAAKDAKAARANAEEAKGHALAARRAAEEPLPYLGAEGVDEPESKPRQSQGRQFLWVRDIRGDVEAIKKKLGA